LAIKGSQTDHNSRPPMKQQNVLMENNARYDIYQHN